MFREITYTDVSRSQAQDDVRGFVMDEEAFRSFYDRTARSLWLYLARITGDRHQADDLLQEAFYRFLRADAVHESETHRRNSLFRIATNLARDARRRRLARPEAGAEVEPAGGGFGNPEKAADLNRAMAQLKPRERELLWLAYAEGASHKEIANVLGLQPSSMKILLFRARRRLAVLLGREESTNAAR
ncbi:MAG: RNA polymerase sigma factor [Acidobacteriota bacterium]|nr:RNA polymerase sigma factor [Acidobacteriota bacterium]